MQSIDGLNHLDAYILMPDESPGDHIRHMVCEGGYLMADKKKKYGIPDEIVIFPINDLW